MSMHEDFSHILPIYISFCFVILQASLSDLLKYVQAAQMMQAAFSWHRASDCFGCSGNESGMM
jgi:hypothetical protein